MAQPTITYGFNTLKEAFKLANVPAWQDVLKAQTMDVKEAAKVLGQKFKEVAQAVTQNPNPAAMEKIIQFLQNVARTGIEIQQGMGQSVSLKTAVDNALAQKDAVAKTQALIALFTNQQLIEFFAEEMTKFSNLNQDQKSEVLIKAHNASLVERNSRVGSQVAYDDLKRVVYEIMSLIMDLCDLGLIKCGFDPAFFQPGSKASNPNFVPMPMPAK